MFKNSLTTCTHTNVSAEVIAVKKKRDTPDTVTVKMATTTDDSVECEKRNETSKKGQKKEMGSVEMFSRTYHN